MAQVFDYVVYTVKNKDGKGDEEIIMKDTILAKNEQSAGMQIARKIPEKYEDQLLNDIVKIKIRPF